jgi:tetratricopeptide (TPR) repeat protein
MNIRKDLKYKPISMKTGDYSYFSERYLAGEMNEAEKEWFRNELGKNEKLREEITLRQNINSALRNHEVLQFRSKLSAISKKKAEEEAAKKPKKNRSITRAAIFTGLILCGSLTLLNTRNLTTEEVFERYYKSYDVTTPLRSVNDAVNSDYSIALEYFNIRDYRNAAYYFSKVISNDPRYIESVMMTGISRFEEENYPEASASFTKVVNDKENLFFEDAQWYLALCYIKTGEKDKAMKAFSVIRESESIYSRNARKILRKID